MRKVLMLLLMALVCFPVTAQKDVTKFLGIPVDGTKAEMRRKLVAKGFTPTKLPGYDFLEGEFNGTDVNLYIVTNNNKVYRISLFDAQSRSEADIKIRYNNLVRQFNDNKRYVSLEDYTLSEEENISYEMAVHKKSYQAAFFQMIDVDRIDTLAAQQKVKDELLKKYTAEQLESPTAEMQEYAASISCSLAMETLRKKLVWFTIIEYNGEYRIAMYYDNEYNHANGEDL
ncbi:MAG TPA: hypothetical protein DC006_04555 [Prevotellaceae bacterium]|nr:hypothetical protein [Prevotellaceae bacterium]HBE55138.1 hypothetical protein [Prevotellaceae bacterium]